MSGEWNLSLWKLSGYSPIWEGMYISTNTMKANPLVNALCAGILRHEDIQKGAATGIGNPVYYVGPEQVGMAWVEPVLHLEN